MVSPATGAALADDDQVALVAMPPEQFRDRVAPVYLRRNQVDVLHELPERIEVDEWVQLSATDEAAYVVAVAEGNAMAMRVAATLGASRLPAPPVVLDPAVSRPAPGARSAKLERLEDLLDEYREDGAKVIVFSYFRDVLDAVNAVAGGTWSITGDTPSSSGWRWSSRLTTQPGSRSWPTRSRPAGWASTSRPRRR